MEEGDFRDRDHSLLRLIPFIQFGWLPRGGIWGLNYVLNLVHLRGKEKNSKRRELKIHFENTKQSICRNIGANFKNMTDKTGKAVYASNMERLECQATELSEELRF